jgi:hypothetical protein
MNFVHISHMGLNKEVATRKLVEIKTLSKDPLPPLKPKSSKLHATSKHQTSKTQSSKPQMPLPPPSPLPVTKTTDSLPPPPPALPNITSPLKTESDSHSNLMKSIQEIQNIQQVLKPVSRNTTKSTAGNLESQLHLEIAKFGKVKRYSSSDDSSQSEWDD